MPFQDFFNHLFTFPLVAMWVLGRDQARAIKIPASVWLAIRGYELATAGAGHGVAGVHLQSCLALGTERAQQVRRDEA